MSAYIHSIEYYLPNQTLTNAELGARYPHWNIEKTAQRAGIQTRHISAEGETAFDLAKKACDQLFAKNPEMKSKIDGILFCTQSPDFIMPSNSHLMHAYLGLSDRVLAFDFNLACSGFLYGLAMANSFIQSGLAQNILLITADTYSKYIHPEDRSARVLFGDGAAVTLISNREGELSFLDFELLSHGKESGKFCIPAGGLRTPKSAETSVTKTDAAGNVRSLENIHMDGMAVWSFINSAVPKQIKGMLAKHELSNEKIDQFIFHQASKMTLDSLMKVLGIQPSQAFSNLLEIGNTVSASIPILLKDATDQGVVKRGDLLLVSGFGVGLSYGSALVRY